MQGKKDQKCRLFFQWFLYITGKLIAEHYYNGTKEQDCCKYIGYIETRKVASIDIMPNNVQG